MASFHALCVVHLELVRLLRWAGDYLSADNLPGCGGTEDEDDADIIAASSVSSGEDTGSRSINRDDMLVES